MSPPRFARIRRVFCNSRSTKLLSTVFYTKTVTSNLHAHPLMTWYISILALFEVLHFSFAGEWLKDIEGSSFHNVPARCRQNQELRAWGVCHRSCHEVHQGVGRGKNNVGIAWLGHVGTESTNCDKVWVASHTWTLIAWTFDVTNFAAAR